MLTCQKIGISHNENQILLNFSVSLYPRSITFIRGLNGSGKTSLLRVLSSLVRPFDGKVFFENKDINKNLLWYRNQVNYTGHTKCVKNSLSLFENIEFWANIYQTPELIAAAIYYFQLTDYIDSKVEYLSAGIRQRIELTRLITKRSQIWLLDEPENNLDKKGRELLNNLLVTKAEQGGIVIIASHIDYNLRNSIEINLNDFKI